MKTAIKRENDECLVMTLKHVNFLGTPKLWGIAHENGKQNARDKRTCEQAAESL